MTPKRTSTPSGTSRSHPSLKFDKNGQENQNVRPTFSKTNNEDSKKNSEEEARRKYLILRLEHGEKQIARGEYQDLNSEAEIDAFFDSLEQDDDLPTLEPPLRT